MKTMKKISPVPYLICAAVVTVICAVGISLLDAVCSASVTFADGLRSPFTYFWSLLLGGGLAVELYRGDLRQAKRAAEAPEAAEGEAG